VADLPYLLADVLTDRATTTLPLLALKAATPAVGLPAPARPVPPCNPKVKDVTRLPAVMEACGWKQGATLLRQWLAAPSAINPTFGTIDTTTITMDFVLTFPRAKKEFDRIFERKLFFTERARAQIAVLVRRLGKAKGGSFDYNRPVQELDPGPEPMESYDVTYVPVGSVTDRPDGLTASLGRFSFKVVVAGKVDYNAQAKRATVHVTDVGVHVEDRFEFEGWQPLGCWNICTNEVGRLFCGGADYDNADFRDFRTRTGKGGDIWVLSDVKSVKLSQPETFDLP
jgi:hypothetical protein